MNVTPEREAPIIPKATTYQGDLLLPIKKEALSAWRPVTWEMTRIRAKYSRITVRTRNGVIISIYPSDEGIIIQINKKIA
jgi:hypothetical protein